MHKILSRFHIFVLIFLGGCSAASLYGVHGDYTLNSTPGEGLVAFSTRWVFDCPQYGLSVNPLLFLEGTGQEQAVHLDNPIISRHFENPPGYFYVLNNKAGDYKLTRVRFGQGWKYQTQLLDRPFKIREGKVTYLGEISFRIYDCKFPDARGEIKTVDHWNRDRQLFEQRLPKVDKRDVILEVLRP